MTTTEIQSITLGTILIHNRTSEPFRVTGLNEIKRDKGTLEKVSGIDNFGDSYVFNLAGCSISNDMTLMY